MSWTTDNVTNLWENASSQLDVVAGALSNGSRGNHTAVVLSRAIPLGLVLGAFIVFAIVGNILVILSVVCNRHLRTPTNYFIINLAIADLLLGTMVLPVSATQEIDPGLLGLRARLLRHLGSFGRLVLHRVHHEPVRYLH